jgi:hypothetical protein
MAVMPPTSSAASSRPVDLLRAVVVSLIATSQ